MKEIKCSQCKRILSHSVDRGHRVEGYYLYNQHAYCSKCWDNRETGMVILSKKESVPDENGETTWVVLKNGIGSTPTRSDSKK